MMLPWPPGALLAAGVRCGSCGCGRWAVWAGMRVLMLLSLLPCLTSSYLQQPDEGPSYRYVPEGAVRITSVLVEPYLMHNERHQRDADEPRYVGYVADLVHKVAEVAGFRYVLLPTDDNSFGYKQPDGSWSGTIGDIRRMDAEIIAAPMYKTQQRAKVVTFTEEFMTVHATMLLRKPPSGATLTIRGVSDLINQSEIKFGTLNKGVIVKAFKESNSTVFRIMWRKMLRFDPTAFTESNQEGIDRVRAEKYAYIIPHTIGDYMTKQEPCDLVTVGKFLMSRGYSFALPKGSPLLPAVNEAVIFLKRSGYMDGLYRKWWTGRNQCSGVRTGRIVSAYDITSGGASTHARNHTHDLAFILLTFCIAFCVMLSHNEICCS